jgi:hypothetical protein
MFKFNSGIILSELKKNLLKHIVIILFIFLVANSLLYYKLLNNYYTVIISLNQSIKFSTKLNFTQKLKKNDVSQILDFEGDTRDLKRFIINEINISKKNIDLDENYSLLNDKNLKFNVDNKYPFDEMLIYINTLIVNYESQEYSSFLEKKSPEPRIFTAKLISYQKNNINFNAIIMFDIFLVVAYFLFYAWHKNFSVRVSFLRNKIK